MIDSEALDNLLVAIRSCRACDTFLPLGAKPIIQAGSEARILIVGQAPGAGVHATGIPWDDPSGERLRSWMGISPEVFYDRTRIAIMPMGYCYPGRGQGGDAPPRPECAVLWHDKLLAQLPAVELTLLVGSHAQRQFLGRRRKSSLTETVRSWKEYGPAYIPLPHPSPRNQPWLVRHTWFEQEVAPALGSRVRALLEG